MKNEIIAIVAIALANVALAQSTTNDVTTLEEAVASSGWTANELLSALQLMEAKYERDVSTASGRRAWHGKKLLEEIDTNTLTKVSYYEDGTTFTDQAKIVVSPYNANLPKPVITNGIPARLAAARLRRANAAKGTNTVVKAVTAGE